MVKEWWSNWFDRFSAWFEGSSKYEPEQGSKSGQEDGVSSGYTAITTEYKHSASCSSVEGGSMVCLDEVKK